MQFNYTLRKLPGIILEGEEKRPRSGTLFFARSKGQRHCAHCGSEEIRKRGKKTRIVRHSNFDGGACFIHIKGHKYECKRCHRYFNERYPGIQPKRRYTELFRKEIVTIHNKGINQTDISKLTKIGTASVERWYQDFVKVQVSHWKNAPCPRYIGIDEHTFSKTGTRYATTLCDLVNNRIFDIIPSIKKNDIVSFFDTIPNKNKVEMINMDLSDSFRSTMKEIFPKARIVADRFHVIRIISHHFQKTWHQIDPKARYNRGILSLMRTHEWELSENQKQRLKLYLNDHPEIEPIYQIKQDLCALMSIKKRKKKQCKKLIKQLLFFIDLLKNSFFPNLVTLSTTLNSWSEEIVCMWRYTKTNSITEGFHRKMKLIQRRAFGFKNFENYRLRVLALCGYHDFCLS